MAAIRLGTAANVRNFQVLLDAPSTTDQALDRESLRDEFGRLRVWSGNLGALQKGHSSLDYRLRDSPLLSSNVLKLLQELEQNLSEATSIVSGARLPYEQQPKSEYADSDDEVDDFFSEDEDDENSESGGSRTELGMRFAEVRDIVDNLYKLSSRIRLPTIKSRSLKAASYQPKDPDTGVDILAQYAIFDYKHTQELVRHLRTAHASQAPPDGEQDIIVDRLARAVTLRRRQFKYWSRHREKLGASNVVEESPAPLMLGRPEELHRNDTQEALPDLQISTVRDTAPSQKTGKTLLSGTEATHYHQSLDDIVDSKSVTSYATTVKDLTGKGIELPPPPKTADGNRDFECLYCFIICPARYGKGRPWKTHILQDLQPYVCTYEDCDLPDQLFRSRKEWAQHEASHRKAWRCPEHPEAVFNSSNGLRDHLLSTHGDSFPESQLDSIVNVGETTTVDTRPVCSICYARADTEGMNFHHHLANHLERIAIFALPTDPTDDEEGASSQAFRGRTDSTDSADVPDIWSVDDSEEADNIKGHTDARTSAPQASSTGYRSEDSAPLHRLSEELLRALPDARKDRMSEFFSTEDDETEDLEELEIAKPPEVVENNEQRNAIEEEFMTLPGAKSVRLHRRSEYWAGVIHFQDEASAAAASQQFSKGQYPKFAFQESDFKASVIFRVPLANTADIPTSQEFRSDGDEPASQSISSSLLFDVNDREGDIDEQPSLSPQQIPSIQSLYRSGKLQQGQQLYGPNESYNQIIAFCVSNLVSLKVEAIVNSANRSLKMTRWSSTLNNSVHKAAGPELQAETKNIPMLKPGQAALTKGYKLFSDHIIHVVRPHYTRIDGTVQYDQLSQCYQSALELAETSKIKTVAFPLLGAGGCGFPLQVAARVAFREVRGYLDTHKDYSFEKIIFTAYTVAEEKAVLEMLPAFFPPTHEDVENAMQSVPDNKLELRQKLGAELAKVHTQTRFVYRDVNEFVERQIVHPDGGTRIAGGQLALQLLAAISNSLRRLREIFLRPKAIIIDSEETVQRIEQLCDVMNVVCGSITEITEQGRAKADSGQPSYRTIWEDYNSHMRSFQGMDLPMLLEICRRFAEGLEDALIRRATEWPEIEDMSLQLRGWLRKQVGRGEQSALNHFDEVLYSRQFQQTANTATGKDAIKLHELPSIARLYSTGELEHKPTAALPSVRFNDIVCLASEDITRLEVDIIVNSTTPEFDGEGSLDRIVQLKGGTHLREECSSFGLCDDGTIKTTKGYLLPAKHILHVVLPAADQVDSLDVLRKIYREVLSTATSMKVSSIAIPTIGLGELGYRAQDCAEIAIEEVKTYLELIAFTSVEKIVFVVYTSNHERIYKSLLPVYFPPLDSDVNNALSPQHSPSSQPVSNPETSGPSELPGHISHAQQGIQSSKEPNVNSMHLPKLDQLNHLDNFEAHARDCLTCVNVETVFMENGKPCSLGYAAAQLVLNNFYMYEDQTYFTSIDGSRRNIEIQEVYPLSWQLLKIARKSYPHNSSVAALDDRVSSVRGVPLGNIVEEDETNNDTTTVLPSPSAGATGPSTPPDSTDPSNQGGAKTKQDRLEAGPGDTTDISNMSIGFVHLWSANSSSWELFLRDDVRIRFARPGPGQIFDVVVFGTDSSELKHARSLGFRFNPYIEFHKRSPFGIEIRNARIYTEEASDVSRDVLLTARDGSERKMLLEKLLDMAKHKTIGLGHSGSHPLAEREDSWRETAKPPSYTAQYVMGTQQTQLPSNLEYSTDAISLSPDTGTTSIFINDPSQWSAEAVQLWLANNGFSSDWQETFKTLGLEGSKFLEIGFAETGHGSGKKGNTALMHQTILPTLKQQCIASGISWDPELEKEEGRRLRVLLRAIGGTESSSPGSASSALQPSIAPAKVAYDAASIQVPYGRPSYAQQTALPQMSNWLGNAATSLDNHHSVPDQSPTDTEGLEEPAHDPGATRVENLLNDFDRRIASHNAQKADTSILNDPEVLPKPKGKEPAQAMGDEVSARRPEPHKDPHESAQEFDDGIGTGHFG